ncbi:MAG: glycoside hydrolase family 76 protein, partial [Candidatus Kapaibacterium sp.]
GKEQLSETDKLKQYYQFSSALYEKTSGTTGARILARQGDRIYIGGDDDMQWCAALVHCYLVTHDEEYLKAATSSFNALVEMGFWQDGSAKGWSWNSADRRPNGVSTAYGALAAARLYKATKENAFKQWVSVSLYALTTPQVGFFPRDMMVAASAAIMAFEVSGEIAFKKRAMELEEMAVAGAQTLLHHEGTGERNPTDIGDLADGLYYFYKITHNAKYKKLADTFICFFVGHRNAEDIGQHGFYSRYDTKGNPVLTGAYLGVPCTVLFFSEVAEMQKLFAVALNAEKK